MGALLVDAAALGSAADTFDDVTVLLEAAMRAVQDGRGFGAATAGRDHAGEGAALARTLDSWPAELIRWSAAAGGIAAALRSTAAGYRDADAAAATGIG